MTFITLSLLATAALMFFVSMLEGAAKVMRFGDSWLISNRDVDLTPHKRVARAHRAKLNTLEAMAMFLPVLIAAGLVGPASGLGKAAVVTFLLVRLAYPFAYLLGWPAVRTALWFAGLLAIITLGATTAKIAFATGVL